MKKGFMKNKRGQITIFIIIAVVIVVAGILIYTFYPEIQASLGLGVKNPQSFIQSCIEEEIEENVEKLSLQGGSLDPTHYIMYNNNKIEYICYTGEYYKTCVVQQPMLKEHVESEIKNEIDKGVDACFDSMEESYQKKGYDVNLKKGSKDIELLPKRIVATFDYSLTLTKGEDSEKHDSFRVVMNNNLYELISIANSILEWEATYGDAETTIYMNYYHDLKVEKKKQSDGTTIYIITDRNTGNKFQFASRSVAWPPGYGVGE
jgi:cell division protein YceG involved in septum cleavage